MQHDTTDLTHRATNPWLIVPSPRPRAAARLFCLPYAGSGVAPFRPWANLLPPTVELCLVQLPGRETRLREAPYADLSTLVAALAEALGPALDRPFALFGHSMGALLAFELARATQRRGLAVPVHLFVSGRRAPQLPDPEPPIRHLADDSFVHEIVRRYNAIPRAVLEDEDLVRLFLPTLRADLTMLETHQHNSDEQLGCPISAFGGVDDARARRDDLLAWRFFTRQSFQLHQYAGDHFYLNADSLRADLVTRIAGAITSEI
jgi:medium-chain acyl-[acyl-carrier-protein] hydrolase